MKNLLPIFHLWRRPVLIVPSILLVVAELLFLPNILVAGAGGVDGGCSFPKTVSGTTVYETCTGMNLPMWYAINTNPLFSEGDFPCGEYGNQNCGVEVGAAINE